MFNEGFGEEFVHPQHDRIAFEVGFDGAIAVLAIFLGVQEVIKPIHARIHFAMPEHGLHTGFREFHVHPIVPQVME